MSAGFFSRSPRLHAFGPWLYVERDGFMVHAWARYFRLPWHRGFYWRIVLRLGDKYVLNVGRSGA